VASAAATASWPWVTTPVRSGPNCRSGCVPYPYTYAAAFVSRDYLWMYPAVRAALSFVVLAACVHDQTRRQGRSLSLVGALLTELGAGVVGVGVGVGVDHFLHLTVMQPVLLHGEIGSLALLSAVQPTWCLHRCRMRRIGGLRAAGENKGKRCDHRTDDRPETVTGIQSRHRVVHIQILGQRVL
jgi:hypothetical protein